MGKNFSISVHVVLGVALIAAISAVGYYRSKYLEIKDQTPKVITKTVESKVSAEKDTEITYLKNQLAELKAKSKVSKKDATIKKKPKVATPKPKFSLLDLKAQNPDRYQKIMDYYSRMNKRMSQGVEDKMVFFNDLDTTGMTDKELENHQKLLEKLAKMHEATEKAEGSGDAENLQNTMRSQWQNHRELSPLLNNERDFLLMDAGRKMGFTENESKQLKDYVKNAYDVTSGNSMFRGGRSRRKK